MLAQEYQECDKDAVIKKMRSIQKISKGYPVHQDDGDVIEGYRELGIKWPIDDTPECWSGAWEKILFTYSDSLKALLDIINQT